MNNTKLYAPGSIICREGEPGDCMYEVESGKVGVYHDYGGPDEKLIAELYSNKVFGEMGLLDHAPHSATVVALEENTTVTTITSAPRRPKDASSFSFTKQQKAATNRARTTTRARKPFNTKPL